MSFFTSDNFLTRFIDRVWDVIQLNLLFLLCCIPIITIGPALTALWYSCLKLSKNDGTIARKNFFRAFRENFKQSLVVWLICLVFAVVLFCNYRFLNYMESDIAVLLRYLNYGITAFIVFIFLYIFPVIATFRNTTLALVRNAFLFAFMNIPVTLCMAVIWIFPIYLTFLDMELFGLYLFCWISFGFATLTWLCSSMLYRVFKKYLPEEKDPEDEIEDLTETIR